MGGRWFKITQADITTDAGVAGRELEMGKGGGWKGISGTKAVDVLAIHWSQRGKSSIIDLGENTSLGICILPHYAGCMFVQQCEGLAGL